MEDYPRPTSERSLSTSPVQDPTDVLNIDDVECDAIRHSILDLKYICELLEEIWRIGGLKEQRQSGLFNNTYFWSLVLLEGACRGVGAILVDKSRLSAGHVRLLWSSIRLAFQRPVFLEPLRVDEPMEVDGPFSTLFKDFRPIGELSMLKAELKRTLASAPPVVSPGSLSWRDFYDLAVWIESIRVRYVQLIAQSAALISHLELSQSLTPCNPYSGVSTHNIACLFASLPDDCIKTSCSYRVAGAIHLSLRLVGDGTADTGLPAEDADLIIKYLSRDSPVKTAFGSGAQNRSSQGTSPVPLVVTLGPTITEIQKWPLRSSPPPLPPRHPMPPESKQREDSTLEALNPQKSESSESNEFNQKESANNDFNDHTPRESKNSDCDELVLTIVEKSNANDLNQKERGNGDSDAVPTRRSLNALSSRRGLSHGPNLEPAGDGGISQDPNQSDISDSVEHSSQPWRPPVPSKTENTFYDENLYRGRDSRRPNCQIETSSSRPQEVSDSDISDLDGHSPLPRKPSAPSKSGSTELDELPDRRWVSRGPNYEIDGWRAMPRPVKMANHRPSDELPPRGWVSHGPNQDVGIYVPKKQEVNLRDSRKSGLGNNSDTQKARIGKPKRRWYEA